MYGIFLVMILVATGGLVAFWGDKVGRRVGKKRLSLFGLRPRYTSVIITVITGIVISTATLAILAIVSKDVRTALFGMKELQASLVESESRLASVRGDLTEKTRQVKVLSNAIAQKTQEFEELNLKLEAVQTERDMAAKELSVVVAERAKIQAQLSQITAAYQKTKADYAQVAKQLEGAKARVEQLKAELAPLQQQIDRLETERYNLLATKTRLEREIADLDQERAKLKTGLESMVFGRVVYRADEIVLSTVIKASGNKTQVQNELSVFLAQANKVAVARGAQVEGKQGIGIKLLEGNFETASNIISQLSTEMVVRLISMTNVLEGGPVLTYFQILPKTKLWSRGETIVSSKIDGSGSLEQIQMQIMDLLATVNNLAISRGMVADSEGMVGDLSLNEFKTAVNEIMAAGEMVTVEAKATRDVWTTVLPLELKLNISR